MALLWIIPALHAQPVVERAKPAEIAALVEALGDSSYEARTAATRRICVIGPAASSALRAAVQGNNAEIGLRARQLLMVFDQLLFSGADVSISFSKTQVAWNEPVDLIMVISNTSEHSARLPFDLDAAARGANSEDARQVMDLLDVADWLKVREPGGRELELRMDDFSMEPEISAAVESRARGAGGSIIPPGEAATLILRNINRGWARYAMLDPGEYTVVLDYTPEWTDEVLVKARAGQVLSNAAGVRVTEGAPSTVSRSGAASEIIVEKDADSFVARFLNRADRVLVVNANFGSSPPFADGRWVLEGQSDRREIPVNPKAASTWKDYQASRLLEVEPGQTIELARILVGDALKALDNGPRPRTEGCTIGFTYNHLADRAWQARQGSGLLGNPDAPPILREPLPRQLVTTRLSGNRLPIPFGQ